ncbi:thioredoxin domain-containing protein [Rhodococcus sp. HNM0563]|uniref:thioredoxin domain-containing protein n=1 Tax=unclassified Rhodococcus (in: high G+C Gram-positive bacteria) TaxID=192944 RepID=UPI00146F87CD|nr:MULTISPECIES: thioredoxin domain-containing protein [unclassified Rhodococcus (in: high G+C Gram-positive bacteria)]MCK0089733.1 thioredoxin domain-containing protein [Rhodococcus sp. F64268]NLU62319.1 thioredoxin domain-containing protein [Rhodococcus sp. HNM0563]
MANRLAESLSPYLRQHADNPVHWQEWGGDALAEARDRDVPILLSVGYAACHWCHVMAHESFEDDHTAALMNEHFVCIKVDREERPDIDAVYMNATVAMTGQGGWPMTCFLTPGGEPFYCGTYYPKMPRGGMPSFVQLLGAITDTWRNRRDDVAKAAAAIVAELQRSSGGLPPGTRMVGPELLDAAAATVASDEDKVHGGFGGAPKFPPSNLLEGLLRGYERTRDAATLRLVERTAEAMARGGIHDQLGGGFARYSVDTGWVVPHFEKMLYDNAMLLRVYAHLARITDAALPRRVTKGIAGFLLRDLRTEEGCFASALDADTDGVEGLTYVWTPQQLVDVLGDEDGAWAAEVFAVTDTGMFEAGTSVLQLPADPDDQVRTDSVRVRLFRARSVRPQPGRDDKVVTAWNALAITGLVEAGLALGRPDWVDAAADCARGLLNLHLVDGRLRRASLGGSVGAPAGVLEDHGALITALLALYQATGEVRWLDPARQSADAALTYFADPDRPGSWFDTAHDAQQLVTRPRDPVDGATPSGASLITEAMLSLAAVVDDGDRYAEAAHASLSDASLLLDRAPRSAGHWLTVAEAAVRGPIQVAVAGEGELLRAARREAPGGSIVVGGEPDSSPLLRDRPLVDGEPAAYVCRGFVCDRPVGSVSALREALAR